MDETTEVGSDAGSPLSTDYDPTGNDFTGKIKMGPDRHRPRRRRNRPPHRPEQRSRLAMAKQ
jgi:hypothetical protein